MIIFFEGKNIFISQKKSSEQKAPISQDFSYINLLTFEHVNLLTSLQGKQNIRTQTKHQQSYDEMDQFSIFVFNFCNTIYWLDTEGNEECNRQHRQNKH